MALHRTGLVDLAQQRLALGVRLQEVHQPDGVGCCRHCGRVYPCRSVAFGKALVRHYQRVIGAVGLQPQRPPAPSPDGFAEVVAEGGFEELSTLTAESRDAAR